MWVIKMVAVPRRSFNSFIRDRTCAWMVTSRAVVGSSAIKRSGSQDRAMAIMARWRIPPENSWGKDSQRFSGDGIPTSFSISTAFFLASALFIF